MFTFFKILLLLLLLLLFIFVIIIYYFINHIYLLFTLHMPFMYIYSLILDRMSTKLAIRQMDKWNKLVWVWIVWFKGVHRLRSAHSWRNSLLHFTVNMLWTHPWHGMSYQFMSHTQVKCNCHKRVLYRDGAFSAVFLHLSQEHRTTLSVFQSIPVHLHFPAHVLITDWQRMHLHSGLYIKKIFI